MYGGDKSVGEIRDNFINKYGLLKVMEEGTKILARVIIEIAGKPKEHVEKTLKLVVDKIKENKELSVKGVEFEEPKEISGLFGAFAEIEAEFDDLSVLLGICFDYMPSSVEIIEPAELKFNSGDFTDFINDLQARLHGIDLRLKTVVQQNEVLNRNAIALIQNFLVMLLKDEKNIDELSDIVGIKKEQLEAILDVLVKNKLVKKEGEVYSLAKDG